MKTVFKACTAALLALLGSQLRASESAPPPGDWQPTIDACAGMSPLRPMSELPQAAHLQASVEFRDGRAVRKTVRILKGIQDRRAMRQAIMALDTVLAGAHCPGVHSLQVEALIGPQQAGFQRAQTRP